MPKIIPAEIAFNPHHALYSPTFGDIYHTQDGALNQAQEVFLKGNHLPFRWQNKTHFCIVELGFGLGVNFLASLAAWAKDPLAAPNFNYIALEKHPLRPRDFAQYHPLQHHAAFSVFLKQLQQHYPPLSFGFHTLNFAQNKGKQCTLTLIFGDIENTLPDLHCAMDACFLDGFSPKKNQAMWSQETLWHLRRLSCYGTTLATWSVAKEVCQHLENAEFTLKKEKGLGHKRHRLTGFFKSKRIMRPFFCPPIHSPKRAIVVGAGLAGACCAHFLAQKGFEVFVLAPFGIADAASGNWSGLAHPLPSVDDNHLSQLNRQGFYFTLKLLQQYPELHRKCGILHLSCTKEHSQKMQKIVQNGVFDAHDLIFLPSHANLLKDIHAQYGALFFPQGALVQPFLLCQKLLEHPHIHILPESYEALEEHSRLWRVNARVPEAPIVILAMGQKMQHFLPLACARGQVHFAKHAPISLDVAIMSKNGYIVPEIAGKTTLGASFVFNDSDCTYRPQEEAQIFHHLQKHLPHLPHLPNTARVALRVFSPKRLPVVGKMPHQNGVFCLGALGARGLIFAPLLAHYLAQQISGDFAPLPFWAQKKLAPQALL